MTYTRSRSLLAGVLIALLGSILVASGAAAENDAASDCDFSNTGVDDIVVGAHKEDLGGKADVGAVWVIDTPDPGTTSFGSIDLSDTTFISQNTPGMVGGNEPSDQFGAALTCGDFNNDGFDDLAIGAPSEDIKGKRNSGAVFVAFGSASGITTAGSKLIHQDTPGVPGKGEVDDFFGGVLATGDFTGDGIDDLVVGAAGEDLSGRVDAGAVTIIPGGNGGLDLLGSVHITQGKPGVPGASETGDVFGRALAVGDINGDGFDDLVVGGPGEGLKGNDNTGAIWVFPGNSGALDPSQGRLISQRSPQIPGAAEAGDFFGEAIVVFDLDRDGTDDIMIGAPGEGLAVGANAGLIWFLPGTDVADLGVGSKVKKAQTSQENATFGFSLAPYTASDGNLALAVASPSAGGLVFDGSGTVEGIEYDGGLVAGDDFSAVLSASNIDANIGFSIRGGDFTGDGRLDLVVGAPGDGAGGAIWLLNPEGARRIDQASPGMPSGKEAGDSFGFAVN